MSSFFNMKGTTNPSLQIGVKGPKIQRKDGTSQNALQVSSDSSNPELWLNGKIYLSADTTTGYIDKDDYTGKAATATKASTITIGNPSADTDYYLMVSNAKGDGKSALLGDIVYYNGQLYIGSESYLNRILTRTAADDIYVHLADAQTISGAKTFSAATAFASISGTSASFERGAFGGVYIGVGNEIWTNATDLYLNYVNGIDRAATTAANLKICDGQKNILAEFRGDSKTIFLKTQTNITGNTSITGTLTSTGTITQGTDAVATEKYADSKFISAIAPSTTASSSLTITKNGANTEIVVPYSTKAGEASKTTSALSIKKDGTTSVFGFDGSAAKTLNFRTLSINGNTYDPVSTSENDAKTTITISNVDTATALATSRTIWGNAFDGKSDIGGTLTPLSDGTYDIGTSSIQFKNAYIKGSAHLATAIVTNLNVENITTVIKPSETGTIDIGSSTIKWKDAWFSGTVHGTAEQASKVVNALSVKTPDGSSFSYDGSSAKTLDLKTIIDGLDPFEYKGSINASTTTHVVATPAASKGDVYIVKNTDSAYTGDIYLNDSSSEITVEDGDMLICNSDSTTAGESTKWDVINKNITGAITKSNFSDQLKTTLFNSTNPQASTVAVNDGAWHLSGKALSDFVQTSGNQTIDGTKTFSGSVVLGTHTLTGNTNDVSLNSKFIATEVSTDTLSPKTTSNLILSGNVYLASANDANLVVKKGNLSITDLTVDQSKKLMYFGTEYAFSIPSHTHTSLATISGASGTLTDVKTSGIYEYPVGNGLSGAPSAITSANNTANSSFFLEVIRSTGSNVLQRITSVTGSAEWIRSSIDAGANWSEWMATADLSKTVLLNPSATQTISNTIWIGTSAAHSEISSTAVTASTGSFTNVVLAKTIKDAASATGTLTIGATGSLASNTSSALKAGTTTTATLNSTSFVFSNSTNSFTFDMSDGTMTAKNITLLFPASTASITFPSSTGTLALASEVTAVSNNLTNNYVTNTSLATTLNSYLTISAASNTTTGYTPISTWTNFYGTDDSKGYQLFYKTTNTALSGKSAVGHYHYGLKEHALSSSADLNSLYYVAPSGSSADELDDKTGWYYYNSSGSTAISGAPTEMTAGGSFSLEVVRSDSGNKTTQRLTDTTTGSVYVRTGNSSSWIAWKKQISETDLTDSTSGILKNYVAKAGDTMTGALNMGNNPIKARYLQNIETARIGSINVDHVSASTGSPNIRFDLVPDTATGNVDDTTGGYVTTFMWDWGETTNGYDTQLFIPNYNTGSDNGRIQLRYKNNGVWTASSWQSIPFYSDILPITGGTMTGALNLKAAQVDGNYGLNAQNSNIVGVNSLILSDSDNQYGEEGFLSPRADDATKYDSISLYNGVAYLTRNLNTLVAASLDGTATRNRFIIDSDDTAHISKILHSSSASGPATYGTSTTSNLYLQTATTNLSVVGTNASYLFNHTITFPGGTSSVNYTYSLPSKSITFGDAADDLQYLYVKDSHKGTGETTYAVSGKAIHLDLSTWLSNYDATTSMYACMKKNVAENIPVKKSFGSGITIGSDTSSNIASDASNYKSAGCTMTYDATEQCMRFTFA